MRSRRLFLVSITVAVVPAAVASCSNSPGVAPAGIDEPRAFNDSTVVVLPTQTHGVVRGFVRDVETNEPVVYANVLVVGTTLGSLSLRTGEFAISGVTPGIHKVRAMGMGYKTAQVDSVVVKAGSETQVSFALTQNPDGLRQ